MAFNQRILECISKGQSHLIKVFNYFFIFKKVARFFYENCELLELDQLTHCFFTN